MTLPSGLAYARCVALAALAMTAAGCSPALDWRESRPEGSGATLLFPCRPSQVERTVRIAETSLRMQMHSCSAGGATFSLAVADAGAPDRVTPLLGAWRAQSAANIAGAPRPLHMPALAGATPNPSAGLFRIEGMLPDARPVVEHVAFFVSGTRLYQAVVICTGKPVAQEALDSFFGSIQIR